ncbi:MAG: hypothetical protein KDB00_17125 [Planctomycetales bacterium]|nr:hypothetical protein [Planctomycetales bacterium]
MHPFDTIARQLNDEADKPTTQRVSLLRRSCPQIVRQIESDVGRSGPLIFWGECRNVDEFAGKVIVEPPILESIFRIARQPLHLEHPHAGLQHTYGYLFSVIETPFGKKRDRWVSDQLEQSLDLPTDVLGPTPKFGTLLANATWLAGSIAFRGHSRRNWLKRCLGKRVAPSLRDLAIDRLSRVRSIETIKLQPVRGRQLRVSLITDLVRLPLADHDSDGWLLVYSIEDDRNRNPELVTLFTVSDAFAESVRQRSSLRKLSDIRLRYNAWVPGFPQTPQSGTVKIISK